MAPAKPAAGSKTAPGGGDFWPYRRIEPDLGYFCRYIPQALVVSQPRAVMIVAMVIPRLISQAKNKLSGILYVVGTLDKYKVRLLGLKLGQSGTLNLTGISALAKGGSADISWLVSDVICKLLAANLIGS